MALPEAQLIRQEHIIRDMQFTSDVKLTRKSLVRWLALSLGLISPNESRTLMLDVLETLLWFHYRGEEPEINRLMEKINEVRKGSGAANPKAVRYHLLQLKNAGLVDRKAGKYRFVLAPMAESPDLAVSVEYVYKKNAETAFEKIRKAFSALEKTY